MEKKSVVRNIYRPDAIPSDSEDDFSDNDEYENPLLNEPYVYEEMDVNDPFFSNLKAFVPEVVSRNSDFFSALLQVGIRVVGAELYQVKSPHQRRFHLLEDVTFLVGKYGNIKSVDVPSLDCDFMHKGMFAQLSYFDGQSVIGNTEDVCYGAREKLDGVDVVVFRVNYAHESRYYMWEGVDIREVSTIAPFHAEKVGDTYYILNDVVGTVEAPFYFKVSGQNLDYAFHSWQVLSNPLIDLSKEGIVLNVNMREYKVVRELTFTLKVEDGVAYDSKKLMKYELRGVNKWLPDALYDFVLSDLGIERMVRIRKDRVYPDSSQQILVTRDKALAYNDLKNYFAMKSHSYFFGQPCLTLCVDTKVDFLVRAREKLKSQEDQIQEKEVQSLDKDNVDVDLLHQLNLVTKVCNDLVDVEKVSQIGSNVSLPSLKTSMDALSKLKMVTAKCASSESHPVVDGAGCFTMPSGKKNSIHDKYAITILGKQHLTTGVFRASEFWSNSIDMDIQSAFYEISFVVSPVTLDGFFQDLGSTFSIRSDESWLSVRDRQRIYNESGDVVFVNYYKKTKKKLYVSFFDLFQYYIRTRMDVVWISDNDSKYFVEQVVKYFGLDSGVKIESISHDPLKIAGVFRVKVKLTSKLIKYTDFDIWMMNRSIYVRDGMAYRLNMQRRMGPFVDLTKKLFVSRSKKEGYLPYRGFYYVYK